MKAKDYTGERFGKLLVIGVSERKDKTGHKFYRCLCDCGKEKDISGSHLATGASKSCGCEVGSSAKKRNTTHGMSHSRLFSIWMGMKKRCTNANDRSYKHYGGRGINICDEWKADFMSFYDWSINNGYTEDLSIDRIDVNGNYEPSNCRWVSRLEQAKNKRSNHEVTINGKTQLITDWCKESPVTATTVYARLRQGYKVKDAIFMPDQRRTSPRLEN